VRRRLQRRGRVRQPGIAVQDVRAVALQEARGKPDRTTGAERRRFDRIRDLHALPARADHGLDALGEVAGGEDAAADAVIGQAIQQARQ
jgi:hypothetical protein